MPKTHISFQDRGYYVSRSNWSTDAFGSAMDAGPITGGHGHDDVLSFQAGAYGKQFLIDPGIATYGADPLAGHHRSGWAHNLFIMDDDPNTEANATAIWAAGTYGTSCRGTHNYWGVDASRELVFAPRGYWMVNDFYEGSGSHSVDVLFQLEEYSKITDINNNIVNTTFNNTEDPNMIFGQLSPWDDKMDVYFGNVTGYENFGKITYKLGGTPVPSTTMILEADLNGPSCWNTVLFPVPANNTFNPTFTPLPITLGGTDYLFNETFNSPGIAMAVNTPEGWDIHISLRNSQTIEINDPRFPSIEFTGTQCIISFNSTMGVESIFSSDIDSLVVDDVDIITKTSSLISSSIDKFTIRADSIIPISYYNGTAITNVLFDEDALTIGGYEL